MSERSDVLQGDMSKVNDRILQHLYSNEPLIKQVSEYLINSASKRIRPMLTIISSRLSGYSGYAHINLAAAVEFIHTATLLHDDVVDSSTMRRFQKTAHVVWDNKTSILVGDFLFAQAFKLMVEAGSMDALATLANASALIVEGEVTQLTTLHARNIITVEEYNRIINAKTAELFSASCAVGGIIAHSGASHVQQLKDFGRKLGILFQITDDLLDYFGNKHDIGKNVGDDFAEGKITLPLIFVYQSGSSEERRFLEDVLFSEENDIKHFEDVLIMMQKYGVYSRIKDHVQTVVLEADALLNNITGDEACITLLKNTLYSVATRVS